MKYIIDIEDEPLRKDGAILYKAKGFNSLVFDANGLNKLTPYSDDETFVVGEEVVDDLNRTAYVLVPSLGKEGFVLLMSEYACPQRKMKKHWHKTGNVHSSIQTMVLEAAKTLKEGD